MIRALAIVLLVAVVGCCPCREVGVTTATSMRDSAYTSHHDVLRIIRIDTLRMVRLLQSHDNVETNRRKSYLENDYCTSTAEVDNEGLLTHTLDTKDSAAMPIPKEVDERIIHDTVYVATAQQSTSATTATKRVKKPLGWFAQTQIVGFWLLLTLIIIKNRKTIIRLFTGWRI